MGKSELDVYTKNLRILADAYGLNAQYVQLMEEMAELTQALCKSIRLNTNGVPLRKTKEEISANILEELADVKLVLDQIIYLMNNEELIKTIAVGKMHRTFDLDDRFRKDVNQ